jgi:multidrug efflux pump subunit AcrB
VTLKPWDERKSRSEQLQAIKQRINEDLSALPEGIAFSFSPPAIPGVGTSGGFTFVLEDRAGKDLKFLSTKLETFLTKARESVPAAAIFGFSLLFVFLILAGLYESWSLPFSVLLSTPVAIFGAFFILWFRRTLLAAFFRSAPYSC